MSIYKLVVTKRNGARQTTTYELGDIIFERDDQRLIRTVSRSYTKNGKRISRWAYWRGGRVQSRVLKTPTGELNMMRTGLNKVEPFKSGRFYGSMGTQFPTTGRQYVRLDGTPLPPRE